MARPPRSARRPTSSARSLATCRCSSGCTTMPPGTRSCARCAWCGCRAATAAWCAAASPTSPSASAPSASAPPSARCSSRSTRNAPLPEVLASITRFVESALPGTWRASACSPPTARRSRTWWRRACRTRCAALEQRSIDIRNGSCAAAVYLGRQVLVGRRGERSVLAAQREVALDARLRAAWSTPIKAAGGKLLGALGRVPRGARAARSRASRRSWRTPRSWPASPSSGAWRRRRCAAARPSSAACSRASPKGSTRAAATAGCCR